MKITWVVLTVVLAAFTTTSAGQPWAQGEPALTEAQLRAAIAYGSAAPSGELGVHLVDVGKQWFQAIGMFAASQGSLTPGTQVSGSGFQILVYSPFLWVARAAREQPQPVSLEDFDARPLLRVFALPSTPPPAGPNYGLDVSPVAAVVLQDASRQHVLRPTATRAFEHDGMRGLVAEFPLADVRGLQKERPDFQVVVKGPTSSKAFAIKQKHLMQLRLN